MKNKKYTSPKTTIKLGTVVKNKNFWTLEVGWRHTKNGVALYSRKTIGLHLRTLGVYPVLAWSCSLSPCFPPYSVGTSQPRNLTVFLLKGADLIYCWINKNHCSGTLLKTTVILVANNQRRSTSLLAYCCSAQHIRHTSQTFKRFRALHKLHISGNLEVCMHTQGCSYIQERLKRALFISFTCKRQNKWPSRKYKLGLGPTM